MTPVRSLLLAISLTTLAVTGVGAQTFAPPPGQAPPPMMPMAQPPGGGQQECGLKFLPLRQEADKRAGVLKAAIDRKAERTEICNLFKSYSSAESAMLKFMVANQLSCSIPPNLVSQVKTSQARTTKMTQQVCNVAGPAGPPPPPSLSDALGTSRVPSPSSPRTSSGGTFNTLTGAPPAR
jgi:hypothetical protein